MPKASKETASEHETLEGYEGHFEHFDGGWTVGFETYTPGRRPGAVLQGPARRPVPVRAHGLRDQGQGGFRSGDGEETFETGDAYYVGPGHTPVLYAGTEVVEFSPTESSARRWRSSRRTWRRSGSRIGPWLASPVGRRRHPPRRGRRQRGGATRRLPHRAEAEPGCARPAPGTLLAGRSGSARTRSVPRASR